MDIKNFLEIGQYRLSENKCFPFQIFGITNIEFKERFGKDNAIVTYDRYYFSSKEDRWCIVEVNKMEWLFQAGCTNFGKIVHDVYHHELVNAKERYLIK